MTAARPEMASVVFLPLHRPLTHEISKRLSFLTPTNNPIFRNYC
jgi:hypothetical protein